MSRESDGTPTAVVQPVAWEQLLALKSSNATELRALGVEAAQAACLCGVSRATWYSLRKAGRVPRPVRLGRRVLWRVDELRDWMAAGCPPLSQWDTMKKGRWG